MAQGGSVVTEGRRGKDDVRVMVEETDPVEGGLVMTDGVRNQEHVLDNADSLARFVMSGLAHAVRSVVLHLDARGVVEA